jgi:DNA-binding CsgD family transcriptional regulator
VGTVSEYIDVSATWWALPVGVLIVAITFGFMPGLLIRQVVRLWPKGHPRRAELVAEVYALEYFKRVLFVFEQIETGLFEGLTARVRTRRAQDADTDEDAANDEDANDEARISPPTPVNSRSRQNTLSPRELEVALLVTRGLTNQRIAGELFLSVRTVEAHLSRVFAKLGVSSRAGVAATLNRES